MTFTVIWNLSWDELVRLTSWEISEMHKSSCGHLTYLVVEFFFPVRMKNHYIISVNTFKLRYSAVWIIAVSFTACCVEAFWICKRNKTKQSNNQALLVPDLKDWPERDVQSIACSVAGALRSWVRKALRWSVWRRNNCLGIKNTQTAEAARERGIVSRRRFDVVV